MHMRTPSFKIARRGFTLIEMLLVVGIIALLASVVISAINPSYQLAKTRNTARQSDIVAILNAFYQYSIDHKGDFQDTANLPVADCSIPLSPAPPRKLCLPDTSPAACDFGDPDDGDGCAYVPYLVPTYVATVPLDAQEAAGGDDDLQSDYSVVLSNGGRSMTISAPKTELPAAPAILSVTR